MKTIAFSFALILAGPIFMAFTPSPASTQVVASGEICFKITNNTNSDVTVRVTKNGANIMIPAGETSSDICATAGDKLFRIVDSERSGSIIIGEDMNSSTPISYSKLFSA